jgi:hypothetical protein
MVFYVKYAVFFWEGMALPSFEIFEGLFAFCSGEKKM